MDPRILQVVTDTDRRGAQVFATDLHEAMRSLGHEVRTVALAPGSVGGLDVPVLGQQRMSVGSLRALRSEATAANVVVAHGSTTLPACAISTAGTGSAQTVSELFGVPEAKVRVVPNGVPTASFRVADHAGRQAARRRFGLDLDRSTVLSLGALAPEKGVDLAVRALGDLPGAQMLVVGDGPERASLTALANQVAPERIVFTGSIDDPADAYAAADVVALPSRGGDSMPAVLIEAGLCGLPTVSTPVEGIPEIVLDGETGCLVPVGEHAALTRTLGALLTDGDQAARLGAAARAHCIQHFSIEAVAAQWVAVLAELVPGLDDAH